MNKDIFDKNNETSNRCLLNPVSTSVWIDLICHWLINNWVDCSVRAVVCAYTYRPADYSHTLFSLTPSPSVF